MADLPKLTMAPGDNPLTKDDYKKVIEAQRGLHDLLPVLDAAERAGMDCAAYREVHNFLQESYAKLIKEFFTPPPV